MNTPRLYAILFSALLSACGGESGSSNGLIPTSVGNGGSGQSPGTADPGAGSGNGGRPIGNANRAPIAVNDSVSMEEDSTLTNFQVLMNDRDPDGDTLKVVSIDAEAGSVSLDSSGALTYVPETNFNGLVQLSVVISDGQLSASSTLSITVTAVNDLPFARDDYFQIDEGSKNIAMDVAGNDIDVEDGPVKITSAKAAHGTVVLSNNQLIYTPAAASTDDDIISYSVADATGGISNAVASVKIIPAAGLDFKVQWQNPSERIDGALLEDKDIQGYRISMRNVETEEVAQVVLNRGDATEKTENGLAVVEYEFTKLVPGFFELSVQVVDVGGKISNTFKSTPVYVGS